MGRGKVTFRFPILLAKQLNVSINLHRLFLFFSVPLSFFKLPRIGSFHYPNAFLPSCSERIVICLLSPTGTARLDFERQSQISYPTFFFNCSFLFHTEFTPSPGNSGLQQKQSKTVVITGAVAGASVFLFSLILIAYCVSRRRKLKKKKLKTKKGFAGVNFTAVSMRDRIRAESIRALDESKVLSLFNPDDMKQLPLSSIEYVRDLGSGNFGLVFLGKSFYVSFKDGAYYCYCAYVLRISRYSDFLLAVFIKTGIFLRGSKL